MSTNFRSHLIASGLLLLICAGASVQASTLSVNCGGKYGLTTINAAIKALQSLEESHGPATINVSGACHENLQIANMDRLTLNAVSGASITDASNGSADLIDVNNSKSFTITGFTLTGGIDTVSCFFNSDCLITQDTIQGAQHSAVAVYELGKARIVGGVLQNSASSGVYAVNGAAVDIYGVTIQNNNQGIDAENGASVTIISYHVALPTVIANNKTTGILALHNSAVSGSGFQVTGNGAEGIHLNYGATLALSTFWGPVSITGNAGAGINVGNLDSATFDGTENVTGNGAPWNIACTAPTAVTQNAVAAAGGAAHTNCSI